MAIFVQCVQREGGVENVDSHVTATIEVTVLRWTAHVTATLDGREIAVKQVSA